MSTSSLRRKNHIVLTAGTVMLSRMCSRHWGEAAQLFRGSDFEVDNPILTRLYGAVG